IPLPGRLPIRDSHNHSLRYSVSGATAMSLLEGVLSVAYAFLDHSMVFLRPSSTEDRKSTRLNSSHVSISYAVFCLKKKTTIQRQLPSKPRWATMRVPTQPNLRVERSAVGAG